MGTYGLGPKDKNDNQATDKIPLRCPICLEKFAGPAKVLSMKIPCPYCKKTMTPEHAWEHSVEQAGTASDRAAKWFCIVDGNRGEFLESVLSALVPNLDANTPVWRKGMADWEEIRQTELAKYLESPPPLNARFVNNFFFWLLIYTPIVIALVDFDTLLTKPRTPGTPWHIHVFLNTVFCCLDCVLLKRKGIDVSFFKWWVLLVPVYILRRTRALRDSKWPFVVWVLTFLFAYVIKIIASGSR